MEETAIPYDLPDVENHSFFYINQRVDVGLEAKLHRHDAWEIICVEHGRGTRTAGDTLMNFSEGDVALLPPNMLHRWEYDAESADCDGCVRYLMVAFSQSFIDRCVAVFPEIRNRLYGLILPTDALKFGDKTANTIRDVLRQMEDMDEVDRLSTMLRLLPVVFGSKDFTVVGRPVQIERDVRRLQQISVYVMTHYARNITLNEIAAEVGMNRSAFCSYFKRLRGITFTRFVTEYRLKTAAELLLTSQMQVQEICYMVGFNDLPHFTRTFRKEYGCSPVEYRRKNTQ